MMKLFCDRCGTELDVGNMNYINLSITNYADPESDIERWDFCHECMLSMKRSILNNLTEYEKTKSVQKVGEVNERTTH